MEIEGGVGTQNDQQEFSTELLRVYYGRLFPYDALFKWLSYGNDPSRESMGVQKDFFLRREFSFTIEDDIYIRYQCFKDCKELTAAIQKRQPHKIDIGAVFNAPPKDHTTIKPGAFNTVERELVFDIDMTDYDDIRTCCTGANICLKCWPYMTMAIKVMEEALREDFGFSHILWVYSGRRGVHCWVCDPDVRNLSNDARAAVVEYLSVEVGTSENSSKKNKASFQHPIHPMILRAYKTLEPYFKTCIADGTGQGLLAKRDRYVKILNSMPNDIIRKELYEDWEAHPDRDGAYRWQQLIDATSASPSGKMSQSAEQLAKRRKINYQELESWRIELVFTHCYPRLDANVSKTQNHLLKSPFCVHPKTGRVCIPIDPEYADDFNPFTVPTVRSLCHQVDVYDREHSNQSSVSRSEEGEMADIEKTDMKGALEVFNDSFMSKLAGAIRRNLRDKAERVAAYNGEF